MPHLSLSMPNMLLQKRFENIVNGTLITNQITDVKNTFTAWDRCMSRLYCEWPAIIGIAIGGLILLSLAVCITRRLCCAMSCCCSCLSFLSCCGNCGGCCDGKRNKSSRRMDRSPNFRNQGYVAPRPMMAGGINTPQYAQFPTNTSSNKPINEDALPAMPSWDTATKVQVLDEDVKILEPEEMNSPMSQKVPLVAATAPIGNSSPLTQNRPDLSSFQPRPSPTPNGSYRNPESAYQTGNPYQDRDYRELDNSYPPTSNSENYVRGEDVRYGAMPVTPRGREYGPPHQMPYGQSDVSSPRFAPNRFGSPGPGRMHPDREYGQSQLDQRPIRGYQGH